MSRLGAVTVLIVLIGSPAEAISYRFEPPTGYLGDTYYSEPILWDARYPIELELLSGTLPPGLDISDGAIVGVPAAAGQFAVTLRAHDATGATATFAGTIAIEPATPTASYRLDFESSSTGTLTGTFGDVTAEASGGIRLGLPESDFPGLNRGRAAMCGAHSQGNSLDVAPWDQLAAKYGLDIPPFSEHALIAALPSGSPAAQLIVTFPAPVHEVAFTSGIHSAWMLGVLPFGGWSSWGPGAPGYEYLYSADVCDFLVAREEVTFLDRVKSVTFELAPTSMDVVGFIDEIVGIRHDCPVPLPPGHVTVFPAEPIAGEPVSVYWTGTKRVSLTSFNGQKRIPVEDRSEYSARLPTLPSTQGYNLQVRMSAVGSCQTPAGETLSPRSSSIVRNYEVLPGPVEEGPMEVRYAPTRVVAGASFPILGRGFVPTLEEAEEKGYSNVMPSVSASFQCGSKRTTLLPLESVTVDTLEVVAPAECAGYEPVELSLTVSNARGEQVVLQTSIDERLPRRRSAGRPN